MSLIEHEALAIRHRHGTYTLWMRVDGREVELAYRPSTHDETTVLDTSLRSNVSLLVTVEAGVFIRGVRAK